MAHEVFISYAHDDHPVADAVCARLEQEGMGCWIAPRDVLPGSSYAECITHALHQSRLLVLIYSARSNSSPQVMREVERAVSSRVPIIPFRIEDVPLSPSMEYLISVPHWLDATSGPTEQHLGQLVTAARAQLAASAGQDAPPQADAAVTRVQPAPAPVTTSPSPGVVPGPYPPSPAGSPMRWAVPAMVLLLAAVSWIGFKAFTHSNSTPSAPPASTTPVTTPPTTGAAPAPASTGGAAAPGGDSDSSGGASSTSAAASTNSAGSTTPASSTDASNPAGGTKLTGKVGDQLSDGKWGLQVLHWEEAPSYTLKLTTDEDYSLWHSTADLDNNIFRPKSGYRLVVVSCQVTNQSPDAQALWYPGATTHIALLDESGESHPLIGCDVQQQIPGQSKELLPGTKTSMVVLFTVPQGPKIKELVFTLMNINDKKGSDAHVLLQT